MSKKDCRVHAGTYHGEVDMGIECVKDISHREPRRF